MLQNDFTQILLYYGLSYEEIYEKWWDLLNKYNNKNRFYHNINHLYHLYEKYNEIYELFNDRDRKVLLFTILYHDIIYNPKQQLNELNSANYFITEYNKSAYIPSEIVADLILKTIRHEKTDSFLYNTFLDMDRAILGESFNLYRFYLMGIKKEYLTVYSEKTYVKNRIKFLKNLLNKKEIYYTEHFYHKYEKNARENIEVELNMLQNVDNK